MSAPTEAVQAFWDRFAAATGVAAEYEAWAFGSDSTPDLADELAELVLHGPKRATTGRYDEAIEDGEMPTLGGYSVILDGRGAPVCIIRTTQIDVVPFGEVDEAFAWDEGEGDRSLAFWRRAHQWYFNHIGRPVDEDTLVVLERFELVWPEHSSSSPAASSGRVSSSPAASVGCFRPPPPLRWGRCPIGSPGAIRRGRVRCLVASRSDGGVFVRGPC